MENQGLPVLPLDAAIEKVRSLTSELYKTHSVVSTDTEICHINSGTTLVATRKVGDEQFVVEALLGDQSFSDPDRLIEIAFRNIGLHQLCYAQNAATAKFDPDMCELLFSELAKAEGRNLKAGFDFASWRLSAFGKHGALIKCSYQLSPKKHQVSYRLPVAWDNGWWCLGKEGESLSNLLFSITTKQHRLLTEFLAELDKDW